MYIIGELINGMYKKVTAAIQAKDKDFIKALARRQLEAGADALDVNCGPLSSDVVGDMRWLIETIQEEVKIPLSLDTTKPEAIEACLKITRNKTIINSTSADLERLRIYVPLAKKYNSSLIGLTMDKSGVPQDKERRLELAAQIVAFAQEYDFPLSELYLDPILLPINVAQGQLVSTLEAIRDFKLLTTPSVKTVLGLSNISQGAKKRKIINRTFLVMAQSYGLDAAILDPLDENLINALAAAELVLNKNIYCDDFITAYKKSKQI